MKATATLIFRYVLVGTTLVIVTACNREEPQPVATNAPAVSNEGTRPTDAQITTNVQAKYYADDLVRGRNVSVLAEEGVVTLRGAVESDAAKQRAVALAKDVQGVRDVKDELRVEQAAAPAGAPEAGPTEKAASDMAGTAGQVEDSVEPAWITTKIQAQYFVNPEVKPWNIDVTTSGNGVVTLEGEVDSAEDRTEAVRIARETEGVMKVDDRLRVKGQSNENAPAAAAGAERPDIWLTAKVQSKYFLDDLVKLRNIDVTTQNGVVTLSGTVASEAERRRAVALAGNTEGVQTVTDQLKVDASVAEGTSAAYPAAGLRPVPELKRPDSWITMKVQAQFFLDPEIKGHEVNVDTMRGVVLLKGTVTTEPQKQQAERIARQTEGVIRVINQLTVGSR